jgi:hypothetical protein
MVRSIFGGWLPDARGFDLRARDEREQGIGKRVALVVIVVGARRRSRFLAGLLGRPIANEIGEGGVA